ncbi:hypothetical protein Micbo1qcDRAFT_174254 [Microdochium bolleyi]|uniref:Uncharacterized protein n=1 Tax=Microdochium bolleyi TaxID=196109 RepID=A0A136J7N6_9PEZI|nr:hypothetical protein Micbo1qcDRAFT_174254 [Microdochium bolleyi]
MPPSNMTSAPESAWSEDFTPHDAIGFETVSSTAPTRDDFWRAVRYARAATDPDRLASYQRAGIATAPLRLPYTRDQIDTAVKFFMQPVPGMVSRDRPDQDVWWWAFFEIIVLKNNGIYTRSWAPERKGLARMVLNPPITVELTTSATKTRPRAEEPPPVSTYSEEAPPADRAGLGNQQPVARATEVPATSRSSEAQSSKKKFDAIQSNDSGSFVSVPLAPGTFKPTNIFLGFHKLQVVKAAGYGTFERDYRQAVYARISESGHISMSLRTKNMRWREVPKTYRLEDGCASSMRHGDVLYHEDFAGRTYDGVRSEVVRQSRLPLGQRNFRFWIPTPALDAAELARLRLKLKKEMEEEIAAQIALSQSSEARVFLR